MAQWQMKLPLKDFWHKYPNELTLQQMAQKLIERLKELRPEVKRRFPDWIDDFDTCVEDFEIFAEDETMNNEEDEFDYRLANLYDWADIRLDNNVIGGRKMCWIETF